MHGAGEIDLVFVVHGDTDEELSLARRRANVLTQFVASFDKVVRVASDGGVSHVCEFDIVAARQLGCAAALTTEFWPTAAAPPSLPPAVQLLPRLDALPQLLS